MPDAARPAPAGPTRPTAPARPAAPARVTAFDHATLVVADLGRTRAFYAGLLGMREVARPAFAYGGLWFAAGPAAAGEPDRPVLHVIEAHGPGTDRPAVGGGGSGPPGVDDGGGPRSTRGPHLALRCDDPRAFEPPLEAAGVRFVRRAKLRPDGAAQVFVLDPDGHLLELCSAPAA